MCIYPIYTIILSLKRNRDGKDIEHMKKKNATARKCSCEKVVPRPVTKGFQTFKTGKQTWETENVMLDTAKA